MSHKVGLSEGTGPGLSLRVSVAAIALALIVSGCGRKGKLQPPPGAVGAEEETVGTDKRPIGPDRPFILDRLI